jgi:hypothetical protein
MLWWWWCEFFILNKWLFEKFIATLAPSQKLLPSFVQKIHIMNAFKEVDALRRTHLPFKDGNFIHGSRYHGYPALWVRVKGVEAKLRPRISWGGYPLSHGTGMGMARCFAQ